MRCAKLLLFSIFVYTGCTSAAPLDDAGVATDDLRAEGRADAAPLDVPFGATVERAGVSFRVWAPNAKAAAVRGEFSATPIALRPLGDGSFAERVLEARPGQRYGYVLTARDGTSLSRIDPYGRQVSGSDSIIVDPSAYTFATPPYQRPGKNTLVVYELHVGSFSCPGEPTACGFASVQSRLDELAELGVNVIELMPANHHGSQRGWGYNPHGYYAPHAPYGTPDALRSLVDAAHARGISVVLDIVYNHYDGWKKAPLYCFDGDCASGTSGVYFFSDPKYRSTPWGPRFDYQRAEVTDFIVNNVAFFRSEYRIDGFRWDSVSNIRALDGNGSVPGGSELMRRANAIARRTPGALLIAEDLKGYAAVTASSDRGGLGFDTQWDGGFHYAITSAVLGYDDSARNVNAVRDALYGRYNGDPFERLIYTETHDTVGNGSARLPSRIDPADAGSFAARKRSLLASAILLTAPGVPMLFQGQEMLSIGTFADPPEPLDWSRRQAHSRIVTFYKDLIALRRNRTGVTAGLTGLDVDVYHVNAASKVLAYRRSAGANSDVIVVANFMNRAYTRYDVGLPAGGTWRVRLNSDDLRYSSDFGGASSADIQAVATPLHDQPYSGPIALGPYSVVILSRD